MQQLAALHWLRCHQIDRGEILSRVAQGRCANLLPLLDGGFNFLRDIFGQDDALPFYVDFYTDAFLCAIKRWLLNKDCMPAEKFTQLLKNCLLRTSDSILQKLLPESEEEHHLEWT